VQGIPSKPVPDQLNGKLGDGEPWYEDPEEEAHRREGELSAPAPESEGEEGDAELAATATASDGSDGGTSRHEDL
jgi:hypothetical protein